MKKTKGNKFSSFVKILLSFLVGLTNGFFGGGGGMVCVPVIEKFYNVENKKAHATTIVVMFILSLFSSIIYLLKLDIVFLDFSMTSIGVIVGGIIGAFLLKMLNAKVVRIIFVIAMLIASFRLVL